MKSKVPIKMPLSIIRTRRAAAIAKLSANIEEEIDSDASRSSKCTRGESLLENEKGAKVDSVIESKEEGVKALMLNENDGGMELAGDQIWTPAHSSTEEDNGDSPHNRMMGFGSDGENERSGTKSWVEVQLNEAEKGIVAPPCGRREPLQSAPMAGERNVGEDESSGYPNPDEAHYRKASLPLYTGLADSRLVRALNQASPMFQNVGVIGPKPTKHTPLHSLPSPPQFGNFQSPISNGNMRILDKTQGGSSKEDGQQAQIDVEIENSKVSFVNAQIPGDGNVGENTQRGMPFTNFQLQSGIKTSLMEGITSTWANIATSSSKHEKLLLHYFKPTMNEKGIPSIKPPAAVAVEGRRQWSNCLVGTFLDKKPPFQVVQSIANRMWKKYGLINVMMNDRSFFFFKFAEESKLRQCLEEGPWLFQNKPIHLQRWKPAMDLHKEIPKTVPLWVKLYDVPMEYWTNVGLSYIVSGIGRPISLDNITEETCRAGVGRIGFARVLVEVGATEQLPELLEVSTPCEEVGEERLMNVRVEYQWKPSRCEKCLVFGHADANCPYQPRVQCENLANSVVQIPSSDNEGFIVVQRKGKEKVHRENNLNCTSRDLHPMGNNHLVRGEKATVGGVKSLYKPKSRISVNQKDQPPNRFGSLAASIEDNSNENPPTMIQDPVACTGRGRQNKVEQEPRYNRFKEGHVTEGTDEVDSDSESLGEFMKEGMCDRPPGEGLENLHPSTYSK